MKKTIALLVGLVFCAMSAIAAVNVNTATQAQLETLNGIGPAKAKAIIDYRTKNGPFKTVEELDKVPGIGQGVLGKIKTDAAISGETSVKAVDKKPAKEEKKADKADKKVVKEDKKAEKEVAKEVSKDEKKVEKDAAKEDKKADKKVAKEDKKADTAEKELTKEEKKAAKKAAREDKKADKK